MKRTPLRKVRTKARPGRLKGQALTDLRRQCFERDGYRCQAIRIERMGWFQISWNQHIPIYGPRVCLEPVTWETGEMAHVKAKRRHGDSLANVTTMSKRCHELSHAYGPSGVKPVPLKPKSVSPVVETETR